MDPNETLRRLRDIAALVLHLADTDDNGVPEPMLEMAELFDGLDTWLTRGGFLPDAWATPDRH